MKRAALLVGFLIVGLVAALAPPSRETEAQANCFPETGFCITNPAFADYFQGRGGTKTLGFPVSRSFTLEGFEVQFFQRVVLQQVGTSVNRLNLLDPNVMPMLRVNQSNFPGPDPQIAAQAPQPSSPTYAQDVVQFIQRVSPNTFSGQPVRFFDTFNGTVPPDLAFGGAAPNPDLLTLLNLEIWGLPTSNPAPDPGNGGFIYQRFQRGIMHFDASCGCTQGILVGEYFKSVITARNLPTDLQDDMQGSRYFGQYSPGAPAWTARPGELPGTDMNGAFEQGTGPVTQPPAPPTQTPGPGPAGTATPTPGATGPSVTIQVDDELIDPGQSVNVTVIARYDSPIDWLEFEGVESDNDDDAADDPELARKRFDCDRRTECANVWTIKPTTPGHFRLRARARGMDDVRSEWVLISLRIRGGNGDNDNSNPNATSQVTGTITYRERIALPPNAVVEVSLQDTSRADAPAVVLGQQTITTSGSQVPIPFVIKYDPATINQNGTYAVRARITVDGQLMFTSTTAVLVITRGNPTDVEIVVERR